MAGRTWTYYKKNPEAYKRKKIYDAKLQKRSDQVRKRVEANKANRDAGTYGNGDDLDYDHCEGKMIPKEKNRGRKGEGGRKSKEKCGCSSKCKKKCRCRHHKKVKDSKKKKK